MVVNRIHLFCFMSIVLLTGCNLTDSAAVAAAPVATPTPENYGLYTDSDLQIYADTIDLKIQEALRSNNTARAQELGRKRQELIAEFNRRGLKRKPAAPVVRSTHHSRTSKNPYSRPPKSSRSGLPGED
jgi:hypothetical protein